MVIKINFNHANQFFIIMLLATDKAIRFFGDHGPILFEVVVGRESYVYRSKAHENINNCNLKYQL